MSSENLNGEYLFLVQGIYDSNFCSADFAIPFEVCRDILNKEGISDRATITITPRNYTSCSEIVKILDENKLNYSATQYQIIKDEIYGYQLICIVFAGIAIMLAISSTLIIISMINVIFMKRQSYIALTKILGIKHCIIKMIYALIVISIVVIAFIGSLYPANVFLASVSADFSDLTGLDYTTIHVSLLYSFEVFLVCIIFAIIGLIRILWNIDDVHELDFVREDK